MTMIAGKSIVVLACLAIGMALVAGCTPDESTGQTNPGSTIETRMGEEFSITLDSNQTTGYKWALAGELDESILKLVGSEYRAPDTGLVGAGGKEVWTFKAVGRGSTKVTLVYARPWESVPPEKSQTFSIVAR